MTRRNRFRGPRAHRLVAVALALGLPVPAVRAASPIDHNRELRACVTLAEVKPAEALESALAWQDRGGGDLARLCQALALFHRGDFAAAGGRLEDLAPLLGRDDPKAAADLLGRAGWAYLRAGDSGRAERLYTAALAKRPGDPDLLIDRAFARAEAERFWDALADLDAAIARAPNRPEAYLYRAGAHKALSNLPQARADVAKALELRPNDPDALLLRGNIKANDGDLKAAAEDWRAVLRVAPDTTAARAARTNIDRLVAFQAAPKDIPAKPAAEPARPAAEPAKRP